MATEIMEDRHMFDKTLENRHIFEEIMEDKHMCEEKLKHWDREREAIYISPEICVWIDISVAYIQKHTFTN